MIRSVFVTILLVIGAPAVVAQPIADAARAQAELIAGAVDTDNDQHISLEEMTLFGDTVFTLIDADSDSQITRDEQEAFQLGMVEIADFRGRRQAYDTAQAIVFDIFDRDRDGVIARAEHDEGFVRAHAFADTDGDGTLTINEYLRGFIFNIAMRNAMSAP
ncbi:EF hand [Rhodobacteraceae bacterium THAF1]|uniref:hypothetical protein n=1 Tax=Palleronia sp. THAF1 TaxID=2587842 RepID=UPI000F401453|nr:hypothetical protein [Palleronia sp. THAF1]QFU08351.1 EF hand [Palleronia sp. THAF1]VDC29024.1 EF hand [Rhodobacteraceae bacterium THAF1]